MKKTSNLTYIILLVLALLPIISHAQEIERTEWDFENEEGDQEDEVTGVVTDSQGNVYITGWFRGTINLDPEGSSAGRIVSANNSVDMFVAKYDSEGNFLRATPWDVDGLEDKANDIALSNDETLVYIVGYGQVVVGDNDVHVASFLASNLQFQGSLGSVSGEDEQGGSISVHTNGDVYITGYFQTSFSMGSVVSNSTEGLFVLVLSEGLNNVIQGSTATGTGRVRSGGIDIDNEGNAYITGEFNNTLTFPGIGNRSSVGAIDIFFAKYNADNNDFDLAIRVGGNSDDRSRSIALGNNSLYITGDFKGTTNFNPNGGGASNLSAVSEYDFFVARYTLSGDFLNVYQVGGAGSRSFEQGNDIFFRNNKIYVTGRVTVTSRDEGDNRFFQGGGGNSESDAFLAIFDSNISSPEFVERFGSAVLDFGISVTATDDETAYVGGFTNWVRSDDGDLVNNTKDSFVAKFAEPEEVTPDVELIVSDKLSVQKLDSITIAGRDANMADFDLDGDMDLAVVFKIGERVQWYRNNSGTFSEGISIGGEIDRVRTLSSADFDRTNGPDIVLADDSDEESELRRFANSGSGNRFAGSNEITDDYAGSSDVYAGDLNQDGNPDIVLANFETENIVIFLNLDSSFPEPTTELTTDGHPRIVEVGDFDGDELPDLVAVLKDDSETANDEDQIIWYRNQGEGNFANPLVIANRNQVDNPRGAAIADFDGDRDLDVVVISNDGGNVTIIRNNGDGSFAAPQNVGIAAKPFAVDATDLDGDGNIDILVGSENDGGASDEGTLTWFKNNGSASFTKELLVTVPNGQPNTIVTEDIDDDGDQDIVVAFEEDGEFNLVSANILLSLTNNIQNNPQPLITERSSDQGNFGDLVQLYGANYGSVVGTARVFFGENPAVVEKVLEEGTQLWVRVPDLEDDFYDIVVRLPNGNIAVSQNFLIGEIPTETTITEVSPLIDVVAGTEVTIQGFGFGSSPSVEINEIEAIVNDVNDEGTTIKITMPDLPEGNYNVKVTTNEGGEAIAEDQISITIPEEPLPEFTDLTPQQGIAGTSVTITGSRLSDVKVEFGDTEVLLDAQSATSIVFTVPSGFASDQSYSVNLVYEERVIPGGTFTLLPDGNGNDITKPSISIISLSSATYAPGNDITIDVEIRDEEGGTGVDETSVVLNYQELFTNGVVQTKAMTLQNEGIYQATLTDSELASIFSTEGAVLAISAKGADRADNITETELRTINREITSLTLRGVSAISDPDEPTQADYQMIGIPLQSESVSSQFEELGDFKSDNTGNWTLFRYSSGTNEYQKFQSSSFSDFRPGVGYMFAYRNFEDAISLSGETVVLTDNTFPITINQEFTLISNPYLFDIDWAEVVQYNVNQNIISEGAIKDELLKWKHGQEWVRGETSLRPFEGAFVESTGITGSVTLQIPVNTAARLNSGAKKNSFNQDLSSSAWLVPLTLESDNHSYKLAGVGMHPNAKISGDPFDALTPPRFIEYLDMSFSVREGFNLPFTKDVVPTQNSFVWNFEVASTGNSAITLAWDNTQFGNSDYQLVMLDLESLVKTDFRSVSSYRFATNGNRKFQLFYGTSQDIEDAMKPNQFSVGTPYPNPTSSSLAIPISIPETAGNENIRLKVFDITGQQVTDQSYLLSEGYHDLQWAGTDGDNKLVPPGLYIYQVQQNLESTYSGKFVVR